MKEQAIDTLTQLQIENKNILAIYLWGSITTNEYIEGKSDIDAMAIVNAPMGSSEKEVINESLDKKVSGLKINFICVSELNGEESKSNLTRFIKPQVILYDFPAWIYVCGHQYRKEDFAAGRASLDDVIALQLTEMKRRFLPVPLEKDYVYLVKALAKLIYFRNQKNMAFKPFRYGDLICDSNPTDSKIAEVIAELKRSDWDNSVIKSKIPDLVSYLEKQ